MGGKKRNAEAAGEAPMAKKTSEATETANSEKPMERRKKRKSMDKERHNPNPNPNPSPSNLQSQTLPAASANGGAATLPEFHIGVFKDLAAADASVREAAAEALVRELREVQDAYDRLDKKDLVEAGLNLGTEKDDGLSHCAPSVRYAVRRLILGVSSSRECARQGFALGLTMVATIPSIKLDSLLKLIVNLLEAKSSMKGQEVRDCLLGRLFAYGAVVRSGRLVEEWISNKDTSYIKDFTSSLISLASKKRYLQEPAVSIILDLIEKLPIEALLNHVLEAPGLREWFEGAAEAGNPDALLLTLRIREKISVDSLMFGKLLPYPFSPTKLFASDCLSSLANCLKESTFCQPRVHSVWPVLVNILLPGMVLDDDFPLASNSSKKRKKSRKGTSSEEEIATSFKCFCEVVIEGSLLLSSHDRKHLAFDVVLLLLKKMPASFVSIALSYKLVQCVMDILATTDSWLYKVAQHFLKRLSRWVKKDDVRRVAVIVALQKHSNGKFDSITRTKTVKDLMADFKTESGCMLFIQNLMNMFVEEAHTSDEPLDQIRTDDNAEIGSVEDNESIGVLGTSDFLKSWVIDSLPSIIKNLKLDSEAKFRVQKEILKFLAVQGLFSASLGTEVTSFELQEKFRWPKTATSVALCRMCIEQLQLLLANAQKGEGPRAASSGPEPNDIGSYFMRFLSTLRSIPSISLFRTLSDEDEEALKKLQEMENRLSREERNYGLGDDSNKSHALRYLLIQLLLQVLLRPGEFSEATAELIMCCKKAFVAPDLLEDSGEDELDNDGAPELMDVLVDTLLSLLPESSAPMRSAIEQVFKFFCQDVTDDGLLRMLSVIKKDLKPARRQNAASDDDEDDDEDILGIEDDEDIDKAETGETGESGDQTDDSEAEGGVEEVNEELSGASDDSDSDGGMDDEAMFRMDKYLAQIFKERKNQAGGSETAQSQLVLFKLRVLSLLEIYLQENPGNPQVVMVFSGLAQAYVNPRTAEGNEQLGQRMWVILQKKIFKAKDYPKVEGEELSTLETLLEKNLKLVSKPFKKKKSVGNPSKKQSASWNRHKMIISLAQNSIYWILKVIDGRNFSEPELQRVFDIFQGTLVEYFDSKKSQIKSEFLKEIFRRRPWIGRHLFGFLVEKCSSAKSDFRRVEALDLVMEILKQMGCSSNNESGQDASKKMLKSHMHKLCNLIKGLVTNMPDKQARRAQVRKFCGKIFQLVSTLNLSKSFLKEIDPETYSACESQLGEHLNTLKKLELKK